MLIAIVTATLLAAALAGGLVYALCVVPLKPAIAKADAAGAESTQTLADFVEHDPDAVTLYATDGRAVQLNPAARTLFGEGSESYAGRHFSEHLARETAEDMRVAFRSAVAGTPARTEATYTRADGTTVDVIANLFPQRVNGRIAGVYAVAKDLAELHLAKSETATHRKRLEALYAVATSPDRSWRERVEDALDLGRSAMDFDFAFAVEVLDGTTTVVAGVGAQAAFIYTSTPAEATLLRRAISRNELVTVANLANAALDDGTLLAASTGAFAATPIVVEGRTFGAVGFSSQEARAQPLSNTDRNFIKLLGVLVQSTIENGRQRERLTDAGSRDPLTGLANRPALEARLNTALAGALARGGRCAVHFIDLDGFAAVNGAGGREAGDDVLRIAAKRLATTIRSTDLLARIGGDEFVIVQSDVGTEDDAYALAARLSKSIVEPIAVGGKTYNLDASIGIAMYPQHASDATTMMRAADLALHAAKRTGRGRAVLAPPSEGAVA